MLPTCTRHYIAFDIAHISTRTRTARHGLQHGHGPHGHLHPPPSAPCEGCPRCTGGAATRRGPARSVLPPDMVLPAYHTAPSGPSGHRGKRAKQAAAGETPSYAWQGARLPEAKHQLQVRRPCHAVTLCTHRTPSRCVHKYILRGPRVGDSRKLSETWATTAEGSCRESLRGEGGAHGSRAAEVRPSCGQRGEIRLSRQPPRCH
jgi:hypothetical protein